MKLHLPKFTFPAGGVPAGQTVPLAVCTSCRNCLCSCGNCHSKPCGEICLYDSGELASPDFEAMSEHLAEMLRNRLES